MSAERPKRSSAQHAGPDRLAFPLTIFLTVTWLIASATAGWAAVPPTFTSSIAGPARPVQVLADTGETASVTGTVYDSVARAPLSGAEVQLVDRGDNDRVYSAHTDSLGRFRIAAMHPGTYVAGFFHPSVDALGIESPLRAVDVHAAADNVVDLVIPGPEHIMAAVCGDQAPTDSLGSMAGIVRDANTGLPIGDAKVTVMWHEIVIDKRGLISRQRRVPVQTGEDGTYHACGLPGADTVLASAERSGVHSGVIQLGIPVRGIVRRDFALGDSASAVAVLSDSNADKAVQGEVTVLQGSAKLSGIVHDVDGRTIQGAKIMVWGTGREATSRSDGHFTMTGLPAGTFSLEARAIGYDPRLVTVDLSDRRPTSLDVEFSRRVQPLSRVVVMGKATRISTDLLKFAERSRSGIGHFVTDSDRSLQMAIDVTEVLRKIPGIQVVPSGSFGHVILMRGKCVPVIYVDGVEARGAYQSLDDIVLPSQIAGIEVYTGLGEGPVQYRSNGCGLLLVWTKRGT